MQRVEPRVFLLAETKIADNEGLELNVDGLNEYLAMIQAPEWKTDAPSDSEELIEVMGRACYKSFAPGLNPNVSKVREGSERYLANIIKSGHGSVAEHAVVSFMFSNVSRVFSHELCRHRVGTAISQESLRYVRLTDLGLWLPSCIRDDPWAVEFFERRFRIMENWQKQLAHHFDIDNMKSFAKKKELTSAFRRLAPIGLATHIGWSANHRTLRHVLEMRTSPHAEEEIALVFGKVGRILKKRYPNLYADYREIEGENGRVQFVTDHRKV